ncbi:uncharacterized protein FIBRA_05445 [Fibroporia radiculosa]|uniref:Uncharacterized protein n=1 Tax=Fibroporia radiculosa TaxID=599839 RepID=J4HXJ1_9APHY|nr:uncharacterized protein FIBRA_05445 [Fibroporia radiculosa]CCM03317.1 predicted protein [Fibroporia radiculosa]
MWFGQLTLYTLEHASNHELLKAVIETLRQHMEVWACMNMLRTIAGALFAAHQFWRTRGIQTRALLSLLTEVDNGRYLEPQQREQMLGDLSAYSHALHPTSQRSDAVPLVLPEILLLATDLNPDAPSDLAKSLWYKYMAAPDWAWKVWDNTIASLRQIPVMVSDIAGRRACALRYANFLWHIDQHLPDGFDKQVLEWFLGAGKNEVAALNVEAWDVATVVLLHLCICGALNTTTILEGLIYPTWTMGVQATSNDQGEMLETMLSAVNALFEHLLLRDECGNGMPPMDIFEAQGLQTRRRDVFREPHFTSVVHNLPALVLIEHNPSLPETLRLECMALRQSICKFSVFRQGVYRDLDAVRYAFEKLLESQAIAEDMHESLVTALRLMLRDPGLVEDTGFVAVSSLLTPWKLAATAIEIRLTLKQLGEGLCRDTTRSAANMTLEKLTTFVFQQCKTPEEADFVAEMMTEVSREIAGKFANAGLQRMTELFNAPWSPSKTEDITEFVASAGEVLRLLSKIVERFREDASLPTLISGVQDQFITALNSRLERIMHEIASKKQQTSDDDTIHHASHCAIFLSRLVQFDLGFPGAWTAQTKVVSEQLCQTITQLGLLHGEGSGLDVVAFPLLLDTLYYVLDEAPADPKATTFDPFRNYPDLELSQLPPGMPPDYRKRMRALLPYVALNLTVADLAYASRDASGSTTLLQPVQNRPWEWTEYLGDVPSGDTNVKGDEQSEDRHVVRNSASLALELFGARMTGDAILSRNDNAMVEEAVRTFQDNFSSESVFMRDWRETRVVLDGDVGGKAKAGLEDESQLPGYPQSLGPGTSDRRSSSLRASPAASNRSGRTQSGPSSTSSLRQSPAQQHPLSRLSASTSSEVIDVDTFELPSGRPGKRKATSSATDNDDEIEIVEGPARAAKKPRAKVSAKTRTKKR